MLKVWPWLCRNVQDGADRWIPEKCRLLVDECRMVAVIIITKYYKGYSRDYANNTAVGHSGAVPGISLAAA